MEVDSSAITGGRGLKHLEHDRRRVVAGDSSAITGGRGLKQSEALTILVMPRFVRHYWRTRIETTIWGWGRGSITGFVRHYWRTRIET